MGLQLKGNDEAVVKNHMEQSSQEKEQNPWDVPKGMEEKDYEPKVIHNTITAQAQAEQRMSSPVGGILVKLIIALVVCGVIIYGGKHIVSTVAPEGTDITSILTKSPDEISAELGVSFVDNSAWVSDIYHYAGDAVVKVKAAEELGIVYLNGKQMGVHIPCEAYTMFNVQVGDGEANMYDNTTYPFDNFITIVDNINGGKSSLYIYYSDSRNDCIMFLINNTTNRIQSMTYYYDYKMVTKNLDTF